MRDNTYRIWRLFEYPLIHVPLFRTPCSSTAPAGYSQKRQPELIYLSIVFDSFEVHYEMTVIDRFSRIQRKAAMQMNNIYNIIYGGLNHPTEQLDEFLTTSEHLDKNLLYYSIKQNTGEDVSRKKTVSVNAVKNCLSNGVLWHECQTVEDVLPYHQSLDDLFEVSRSEGCRAQFDTVRSTTELSSTELTVILNKLNKLTIDTGRDRKLLLADGKHCVSIRNIPVINKIKVIILPRHQKRAEALQNTSPSGSNCVSGCETSPANSAVGS